MVLELEWLSGRERYMQSHSSGVILWNYHYRGFFLRPHEEPVNLVVCVQPADMVFRRMLAGTDDELVDILQRLKNGIPQESLNEVYGSNGSDGHYGIGNCTTGKEEQVLAFRTQKMERIKPLWEIAETGINTFWVNYRPDLFDRSA